MYENLSESEMNSEKDLQLKLEEGLKNRRKKNTNYNNIKNIFTLENIIIIFLIIGLFKKITCCK
jgi:hypothetical protein